MSQIFISYASEDRARAGALAAALGERGWSVWWDRKIPLGKSYDEVIETALAEAQCVIVLWSSNSVASEWVRNEAGEGRRREILIPVFIETVEAPLAFRLLNGASLTDWQPHAAHLEFDRLVERVGELLDDHSSAPAASIAAARRNLPPEQTTKEMVARFFRSRLVRGGVATAFVAVFAIGYLLKSGTLERESAPGDFATPKLPEVPQPAARPGESDFEKSIRDLSRVFGGALPATSLAKAFYVPDLGIRIAYISADQSGSSLGALPPGAVVMEVESGRPMARAGIQAGDVITSIAGNRIENEKDLREAILKIGPGRTRYTYRRAENTKTVSVECPGCKAE